MKKTSVILLSFILAAILITGCKDKLVSESCVLCEAAATKNYTSPQGIDLDVSMEGGKKYTLRPGETVSTCDQHYGVMEFMAGKSK